MYVIVWYIYNEKIVLVTKEPREAILVNRLGHVHQRSGLLVDNVVDSIFSVPMIMSSVIIKNATYVRLLQVRILYVKVNILCSVGIGKSGCPSTLFLFCIIQKKKNISATLALSMDTDLMRIIA